MVLGIPLWARRVPPNRFYGVRTRTTLTDEARWYEINARTGRDLTLAAAFYSVATLVIDRAAWPLEMRTLATAAVLIAALVWTSVRVARWNASLGK